MAIANDFYKEIGNVKRQRYFQKKAGIQNESKPGLAAAGPADYEKSAQ